MGGLVMDSCGLESQGQAWDCSEVGNDDRISYTTGNFLTSRRTVSL